VKGKVPWSHRLGIHEGGLGGGTYSSHGVDVDIIHKDYSGSKYELSKIFLSSVLMAVSTYYLTFVTFPTPAIH
jgi:hypothetical protein